MDFKLPTGVAASAMGDERMNTEEHAHTARAFLRDSDKELRVGDRLQGCEKLWGAASHAVLAVAQKNGWSDSSHRALKRAVGQLADEHEEPTLRGGFSAAEKFHRNFYHNFMEEFEIQEDRAIVHDFTNRVLALV